MHVIFPSCGPVVLFECDRYYFLHRIVCTPVMSGCYNLLGLGSRLKRHPRLVCPSLHEPLLVDPMVPCESHVRIRLVVVQCRQAAAMVATQLRLLCRFTNSSIPLMAEEQLVANLCELFAQVCPLAHHACVFRLY